MAILARLRRRLTFANVTSVLALVVALGGSSYAAVKLGRNSVRSANIAPGQVKGSDLANNAVTTKKVKNGSLRASDFARGQLPGGTGSTGPPGQTGPAGSPAASMLTGIAGSSQLSPAAGAATELTPVGVAVSAGSTRSPSVPVVLRDLSVELTSAPGVGASRTILLGVGATAFPTPSISCTISGSDSTCTTGAQTVAVPANSDYALAVQNGPGNAPAVAAVRFGYRATTP